MESPHVLNYSDTPPVTITVTAVRRAVAIAWLLLLASVVARYAYGHCTSRGLDATLLDRIGCGLRDVEDSRLVQSLAKIVPVAAAAVAAIMLSRGWKQGGRYPFWLQLACVLVLSAAALNVAGQWEWPLIRHSPLSSSV